MVADPFYTQRTVLGASTFFLTFRYNARMDRWLADIADANGNTILAGLVIQGGWPIYRLYEDKVVGLPEGSLLAVDLTGQGRDPQLNTFGSDVPLFYFDPGVPS